MRGKVKQHARDGSSTYAAFTLNEASKRITEQADVRLGEVEARAREKKVVLPDMVADRQR